MTGRAPAPTDEDLRVIAEQVWVSYLDPQGVEPLLPAEPARWPHEVTASVSVTGAWRGHVVISCSSAASRHAAAALLGVEPAQVTREDVTDALGELANIIGGNVKSLLPEPSALSLPHVLIDGDSRWPTATEVCRLGGTWVGEPMSVQVLESCAEKNSDGPNEDSDRR